MDNDQVQKYTKAVGKPNVASKGRAAAMTAQTRTGQKARATIRSRPQVSNSQSGPMSRPPGGNLAGLDQQSSTVLQMNGSGYDNPLNQGARAAMSAPNRPTVRFPDSFSKKTQNVARVNDMRLPRR